MSAKVQMLEVVNSQPDSATYDDILRELLFRRMIERGLEDARAGKTITHDEMRQRIQTARRR